MKRCDVVVAYPGWRSRTSACSRERHHTLGFNRVGGQRGAPAKVWTSLPGGTGQSEDFLADPDEALALLFSAGLLEALSPLGFASLLPELESLG